MDHQSKEFQIQGKPYQFRFLSKSQREISDLCKAFPVELAPAIQKKSALLLLEMGRDFLIYGEELNNPEVIIKFEQLKGEKVQVWTFFKLRVARKIYEPTILEILKQQEN